MLRLKNISKKLGAFALTGINLEIPDAAYYVLLGRSGSGKTQLLELIAGLTVPDSGEIWFDDVNLTRKRIQDRRIGLVFQDYAIFPNMTVRGNIAYPLHPLRLPAKEVGLKVNQIAGELNISHLLDRFTQNLSGGELQRVALARTLIVSPRLLLLDEPMASIDASLKDDIKRTLRQLNRKGLTIVHVTHDYREAISLASRVGVIHNGRMIQEGIPDEVFGRPVNKFVARYAGIRNFFRVNFSGGNDSCKACMNGNMLFNISGNDLMGEGLLLIKSEDITIHDSEPANSFDNCIRGTVAEINPSEYGMEILFDAGERFYVDIASNDFRSLNIRESSQAWITFPREAGIPLQGNQ
ncbi:MAG: ABC transporter ATP-binding protein [Bacteroidales bacterium]